MTVSPPILVLASASPRRKYLLEQAGLGFHVAVSHVDESAAPPLAPNALAVNLADAKARAVARTFPSSWIIGADTMVVIGDSVLGKPASNDHARQMLEQLSGQTHRVITGYCIGRADIGHWESATVSTRVMFKSLSTAEIDWYVRTGEPFDKAGAYAVQGLGTFLVRAIHGSYTNVVGLPVCEIIEALLAAGAIVPGPNGFKEHPGKGSDL